MIAGITTAATGVFSLLFSKSILIAEPGKVSNNSIYELDLKLNSGEVISLSKFKGKKTDVCKRCF